MTTILICIGVAFVVAVVLQLQNNQLKNQEYIKVEEPLYTFESGNKNALLVSPGDNKIALLKEIREITRLGLPEAKSLIDNAPSLICQNIDDASALKFKEKMEATGATVNIEENEG